MIRFDAVSIGFDVPVLEGVTLALEPGDSLGLMGAGGVGKSLVLKLCCGLLQPDEGEVWLGGANVGTADSNTLASLRKRIGMAFQNSALFDFMNVGQNIAFPLRQAGHADDDEVKARVAQVLAQVSLPGIEELEPSALSGGMRKRVCLARAVIHRPQVMLCDDPTAGLDPVTSSRIFRLIDTLRRQNDATSIVVSHDTDGLRSSCAKSALLEAGKLVFFGPSQDARDDPRVGRFIRGEV